MQEIFKDSEGNNIKFFIQKDLDPQVQAALCETITELGGRVESKVPRQGYVLVQPGTPEEERLRMCWATEDRPSRYFVPYSYVEACKTAGMHLKQIFLDKNVPMSIHIHSSIANVNVRASISNRIVFSGGNPTATEQGARVILADPDTPVYQTLVKTYQDIPNKHIESFLWVKKCVEKGAVSYTPVVYKNPGGRRPGEERTPFTDADEQHLCEWIAAKIPFKDSGGRTGNRLYQQLCGMSNEAGYDWVTRHTWQSWRERYKKNSLRLDHIIQQIVDQKKTNPGEKGQYNYVRKEDTETVKRQKRKKKTSSQENEGDVQLESISSTSTSAQRQANNDHLNLAQPLGNEGHLYPTSLVPISGQIQPLVTKPTREEEDDPEWAIRIGSDPPPAWAKRKLDQDENEDEVHAAKRSKTALPAAAVMQIATMHFVDRGIRDIAMEFRFMVEEVQEYYDKCGEMNKTRMRFQKMRAALNELPDDD